MIEYSKVSIILSDTQLNKLKTAVKNETGATLRMYIKMFNGNNLPHELLLTTRQKTKLRNAFENNMSTDIKLRKPQILKLAAPSMKRAVPLAKDILVPLGTTVAVSAINVGIQKKIHGSGTTTLITSNEQMNDIWIDG